MKRTGMWQRLTFAAALAIVLGLGSAAQAQVLNPALTAKRKKKRVYRASMLTYQNSFALRDLAPTDPDYNPYYAMSMYFQPQIWLQDNMFVRATLIAQLELTSSDQTDTRREPILSDMRLDYWWLGAYRIPKVNIVLTPSFRLYLPTSKVSQARTVLFGLAPAMNISRAFKLRDGKWFSSLALMYTFRPIKYFNEMAQTQIAGPICSPSGQGSEADVVPVQCTTSGQRNINWRFINALILRINVHPRLFFTGYVGFYNDVLYGAGPYQTQHYGVGDTRINTRAAIYSSVGVTVPAFSWLFLGAGVQSFHPQIGNTGKYQVPLFNRYIRAYFSATFPIDQVVSAIVD